jgi:hypothetical protein
LLHNHNYIVYLLDRSTQKKLHYALKYLYQISFLPQFLHCYWYLFVEWSMPIIWQLLFEYYLIADLNRHHLLLFYGIHKQHMQLLHHLNHILHGSYQKYLLHLNMSMTDHDNSHTVMHLVMQLRYWLNANLGDFHLNGCWYIPNHQRGVIVHLYNPSQLKLHLVNYLLCQFLYCHHDMPYLHAHQISHLHQNVSIHLMKYSHH